MKRQRLIALVLILVISVTGVLPAAAQGGLRECTGAELDTWWNAVYPLLVQYEQIKGAYDPAVATLASLQAAADLQALRRDLEAVEPPACAVRPDRELFAGMFNLAADSIVAMQVGSRDLAGELLTGAEEKYSDVLAGFEGYSGTPPPVTIETSITSPTDGDSVPREVNVEGTFNIDQIGANTLWLFIYAPDSKYYPQVSDACGNPQPIALLERRTVWHMTAYPGADQDVGKTFEFVLGTLPRDVSDELIGRFASWCANNWANAGLTQSQYDDLGVNELGFVSTTRE